MDMAIIPGARWTGLVGRGHRATAEDRQPEEVADVADVRCGDHQNATGAQDAMDLGEHRARFADVLDHLVSTDGIGDRVLERQAGIEVGLDELPVGRTGHSFIDRPAIDIDANGGPITRADPIQPTPVAAAEVDKELTAAKQFVDAPRSTVYLSHVLKITRRKPSP